MIGKNFRRGWQGRQRDTQLLHRTREACDEARNYIVEWRIVFQFTHARGVRHSSASILRRSGWFQFTHARGVRRASETQRRILRMFQFTHARGVRLPVPGHFCGGYGFQFTHARGVRRDGRAGRHFGAGVSIHARTRRATRGRLGDDVAGVVSIHARAGRATVRGEWVQAQGGVSIHARAGRATAEKARELRIRERIADKGRLTSTRALSEKWAVLLSKSEDFPRTFQGWNGSLGFAEGMTGRDTA